MSIFIANLDLGQGLLVKGINNVNFSYEGFVSDDTENQVALTFSIAPNGGEVEIIPGNLSTTLPPRDFPLTKQKMHDSVTLNVITDHGGVMILNVTLTGTTASGASASAPNSFRY